MLTSSSTEASEIIEKLFSADQPLPLPLENHGDVAQTFKKTFKSSTVSFSLRDDNNENQPGSSGVGNVAPSRSRSSRNDENESDQDGDSDSDSDFDDHMAGAVNIRRTTGDETLSLSSSARRTFGGLTRSTAIANFAAAVAASDAAATSVSANEGDIPSHDVRRGDGYLYSDDDNVSLESALSREEDDEDDERERTFDRTNDDVLSSIDFTAPINQAGLQENANGQNFASIAVSMSPSVVGGTVPNPPASDRNDNRTGNLAEISLIENTSATTSSRRKRRRLSSMEDAVADVLAEAVKASAGEDNDDEDEDEADPADEDEDEDERDEDDGVRPLAATEEDDSEMSDTDDLDGDQTNESDFDERFVAANTLAPPTLRWSMRRLTPRETVSRSSAPAATAIIGGSGVSTQPPSASIHNYYKKTVERVEK
uniref:Uncharacterized protein n=1 Tax=Romanomermis culicivorax TaxID=13658 RepID=A0A915IUE7_ROMCU